jgi:hypothetical protein
MRFEDSNATATADVETGKCAMSGRCSDRKLPVIPLEDTTATIGGVFFVRDFFAAATETGVAISAPAGAGAGAGALIVNVVSSWIIRTGDTATVAAPADATADFLLRLFVAMLVLVMHDDL